MSKAGGGCVIGLIVVGVTAPGIGLLLASVTGIAWLGESIGEHSGMVTAYIVVGFAVCYALPAVALLGILAMALGSGSLKDAKMGLAGIFGAAIYMLVASLVFAFPSSFIAQSACHAGNQKSVWVMRVIPVLWGVETVFAKPSNELACVNNHLVGGGG